MFDQIDEGFEFFRLQAGPHQLLQLTVIFQSFKDRQLVPATEIGIIVGGNFEDLVEAFEIAAFADLRRDDIIDDAEIEMIARNANTGMADRGRSQNTTMRFKPDERIVSRTTAKVSHKHGGIMFQALREIERCGNRFINKMHLRKAKPG